MPNSKEELGPPGLGPFNDFLDGLIQTFNVDGFGDEAIHSNDETGGLFRFFVVGRHRNDGSVGGCIYR